MHKHIMGKIDQFFDNLNQGTQVHWVASQFQASLTITHNSALSLVRLA